MASDSQRLALECEVRMSLTFSTFSQRDNGSACANKANEAQGARLQCLVSGGRSIIAAVILSGRYKDSGGHASERVYQCVGSCMGVFGRRRASRGSCSTVAQC